MSQKFVNSFQNTKKNLMINLPRPNDILLFVL
jgi:hypothetical protein